MDKLYLNEKFKDEVFICHGKTYINARGKNAETLVTAFAFMIICVGIAALLNK